VGIQPRHFTLQFLSVQFVPFHFVALGVPIGTAEFF